LSCRLSIRLHVTCVLSGEARVRRKAKARALTAVARYAYIDAPRGCARVRRKRAP
jgi:hypothetical protein